MTLFRYFQAGLLIAGLFCIAVSNLQAATEKQPDTLMDRPLIEPNVERREIKAAKIDTENLEIGIFAGLYATEDFGTNAVTGARLAFHITEDIFLEATVGQTDTSKTSAEELFLFNIVADDERQLTYYDVNIGYNFLPGEVFVGESWAFNISLYLLAGVGSTDFNSERRTTIVTGGGVRFLATDWLAVHMDMRDHVFKQNISTLEKTTHNLESIMSITFFF